MPQLNETDLDVKKLKVRLPHQLRSHKDFGSAAIRVDEDQIHFHLHNTETNLPEIWIFDATRKSWTNVNFLDTIRTQA
jgi:hypothetical protein